MPVTLDEAIAELRRREDLVADLLEEVVYLRGKIADLERRIVNLIRPARVTAVHGDKGTVEVAFATDDDGKNVVSAELRWGMRAGAQQEWDPPSVNEQVIMISPGGDLSMLSWVQKGGFTTTFPKKDSRLGVYKRSLSDNNFFEQTPDLFQIKAPRIELNQTGGGSVPPPASAPPTMPEPVGEDIPVS